MFVVSMLYVPAAHAVQLDAPVDVVPVEEPGPHSVQPVFVVSMLYVPAAHAVQLDAPADVVPVEEPGPQFKHDCCPVKIW